MKHKKLYGMPVDVWKIVAPFWPAFFFVIGYLVASYVSEDRWFVPPTNYFGSAGWAIAIGIMVLMVLTAFLMRHLTMKDGNSDS